MVSIKSYQNGKESEKIAKFSSTKWLTNQAVKKHKEGNIEQAIAFYLEAIESKTSQPAWLYGNLITLLAQQERFAEGLIFGEEASVIHPKSDEVCRALGILYQKQADLSNCIVYYQQAISSNPQQPDWLYCNLAKQLLQKEQVEEALEVASQGIQLYPSFHPLHYVLGNTLENLGRWEQAILSYQRVQQLNPNWLEAEQKLNHAISCKKKAEKLVDLQIHLQQLKSANTDKSASSADYLSLGDKYFDSKMWHEAELAYTTASSLNPSQIWSFYNLGRVLTKQNKITQAIATYYKVIETNPNFPDVYHTIGNLLYEQRRWQEAKQAYLKAVEFHPKVAWYQYNLGRTLLKLNENENAVCAYLCAINIDPDFILAYPTLIQLLDNQRSWEQLLDVCQQSLNNNPGWKEAYIYLGKAQNKLAKYDEAINTYYSASDLFSAKYEVYEGLGDAYRHKYNAENSNSELRINFRESAIDNYKRVININSQYVGAYHKILALDSRNANMYAKLAKVLETEDNLDGAIQFYQIARTICPDNLDFSLQLYRPIEQKNKHLSQNIQAKNVIDLELLRQKLILRQDLQPVVSIIIPVYNKIGYTLNCLRSIQKNVSENVAIEVLVIDDGSNDETEEIAKQITGLKYLKNCQNMGFINSCNHGASQAKGKYLCFLNNDTEVCLNWLESMVETIEQDKTVGIVGSKLVYPNGMLQEAGGVIWSNGEGWNYGRMGNPQAPEFNYLREVDYCSGASLLVKKEIFDSLDGFEKDFVPAYYEDTDLCFAIRNQLNLKVIYQPKSQIVHYEGISSGTSTTSGVKKYQAINSVKFTKKWQQALSNHCKPGDPLNPLIAPRSFSGQKKVLIIEHDLPFHDMESGYRRIFEIIKILNKINCHVIYAPDKGKPEQPYTSQLQNMGVEVLYRNSSYQASIEDQIIKVLPIVDIAWICRPDLNQKYAWLVRHYNPQAKVFYDTIDLHYVRLKRAWELLSEDSPERQSLEKEWRGMQKHELHMAQQADVTLTVTSVEKDALKEQKIDSVEVIPNIHQLYDGKTLTFAERSGILFIGGYKHIPNIDCVEWLCNSIMPLVWQTLPNLKVTLLGSHPTEVVKQLTSKRVNVTGYIKDVTPYFLSHRVFVSPLRFGAGMKGKIGQSLEYGLPVISTKVGVEGMGLVHERNVLIADQEQYFAEQIIRLHSDQQLWQHLAAHSQQSMLPYTAQYVQSILSNLIDPEST